MALTLAREARKEQNITKHSHPREAPIFESPLFSSATRSSFVFAFALHDPRLHQLFHKSCRQRLVHGKADGAFGCLALLEFVFERFHHRETSREETAGL